MNVNAKMLKNLKPKTKLIKGEALTKQEFFRRFLKNNKASIVKYCWQNAIHPGELKYRYGKVRKFWVKTLSLEERNCVECQMPLQTNNPQGHDYLTCDHILPKSKHPHLMLDVTNFQPMCGKCNKAKSHN